jgi:hypothetical protein
MKKWQGGQGGEFYTGRREIRVNGLSDVRLTELEMTYVGRETVDERSNAPCSAKVLRLSRTSGVRCLHPCRGEPSAVGVRYCFGNGRALCCRIRARTKAPADEYTNGSKHSQMGIHAGNTIRQFGFVSRIFIRKCIS